MYASTTNPASVIEGTTPRIQVAAARMSLAKCPIRPAHERALSDAMEALDRLWQAVNGKSPARFIGDGVDDDFEDAAEWPVWVDSGTWATTEPTPLELLSMGLHPVSGGSPESDFEPSEADMADYRSWCESLDRKHQADWEAHMDAIADGFELESGPLSEADIQIATGSF